MPLHPLARPRLLALLLLLSLALPLGATRRTIHLSSLGLRAGTKENSTPLLRKILEGLQSDLEQGTDTLELLFSTGETHSSGTGRSSLLARAIVPSRPSSSMGAKTFASTTSRFTLLRARPSCTPSVPMASCGGTIGSSPRGATRSSTPTRSASSSKAVGTSTSLRATPSSSSLYLI